LTAQKRASEPERDLHLEIGHLLLIDVVGYSKLLVNEQIELLQELNRIVRSTECFRSAKRKGKLIRVPTGDGMALLFFRTPEEPVRCSIEISQALKDHPQIQLRMGVHSGPVNQVVDVDGRSNIVGAGINIAQRVMDCGDAGHILLSKHVADDLAQYRHWQRYLHDFGECEVKHGLRLHIFNLFNDGIGNPQLPQKLKRGSRWKQSPSSTPRLVPAPRSPTFTLVSALLLSAVAVLVSLSALFRHGLPIMTQYLPNRVESSMSVPEKSIAVLPFENLSGDQTNAYFADGVQDEILNDLVKVADLKVISRTSTKQYRGGVTRNLREIAKALGVAHVVEGSVQRMGNRVRVSAQLINARTDVHVWGEHYDRDIVDVFAIESELAEQIVSKLKAKVSPEEKAAIAKQPTHDLVAYDLYLKAQTLDDAINFDAKLNQHLPEATSLLEQAVARDPNFFAAHCLLARVHDEIYFWGIDRTPQRLGQAQSAVETALRLRPNAGESHLAFAQHLYLGYRDYDQAERELAIAARALPNEKMVSELRGYIERRQGHWDEATRHFSRALELDPNNLSLLQQVSVTYQRLRSFGEAASVLDRALRGAPNDVPTRVYRAAIDLWWHADPKPLHSTFEAILREDSNAATTVADQLLQLAFCERDENEARQALASLSPSGFYENGFFYPYAFSQGLVARFWGDQAAAQQAFTHARAEVDKTVNEQPAHAEALCILGLIDAALDNKGQAVQEGQRALELLPPEKDAINGEIVLETVALIYAWVGEKNMALDELARAARLPGELNYGSLRLHPCWDSLRDDPRFKKIVASLASTAANK